MTCVYVCVCVCVVQIILAFGNYMNSSKRGAAGGFRLQSLDLVSHTLSGLVKGFKSFNFTEISENPLVVSI